MQQPAQIDACFHVLRIRRQTGFVGGACAVRIRVLERKPFRKMFIGRIRRLDGGSLARDDMQAAFLLADVQRQDVLPGIRLPQQLPFADGDLIAQGREGSLIEAAPVGRVARSVCSVRLIRCAEIFADRSALAVRSMSRS